MLAAQESMEPIDRLKSIQALWSCKQLRYQQEMVMTE